MTDQERPRTEEVPNMELRPGDLVPVVRGSKTRVGQIQKLSAAPEDYPGITRDQVAATISFDGKVITEYLSVNGTSWRYGRELEAVRAPSTVASPVSHTELARIVAARYGWSIDGNERVVGGDARIVAASLEDLARSLFMLRWAGPVDGGSNVVQYKRITREAQDDGDTVAARVRETLDQVSSGAWFDQRSGREVLLFMGLTPHEIDALLGDV